MKLLNNLKVRENENEKIEILDEEALLYTNPGGDNGSMKVFRLINTIEQYSKQMNQTGMNTSKKYLIIRIIEKAIVFVRRKT